MYKIEKVLNNNTILVTDDETEGVVIYKGIGFGRKNGEKIDVPINAKLYIMQKSYKSHQFKDKIKDIDAIYIEIAGEVLKYAQDKYQLIIEGQLTPLTLAIYFSIKLLDNHSNSQFDDFYFFYPREYDIALKAKEVIYKYMNIEINDSQINHIALHFNTCFFQDSTDIYKKLISIIFDEVSDIEKELNIVINCRSVVYVRLLRHIKYSLKNPKRELVDINEMIKIQFPYAYDKSKRIVHKFSESTGETIQPQEIGYIALHIEEIIKNVNK